MSKSLSRLAFVAVPLAAFALFLLLWQGMVDAFRVQEILLPTPTEILNETFNTRSYLLSLASNSTQQTLEGVGLSTAIALVVSGAAASLGFLRDGVLVVAGAMRSLPTISLYPIVSIFVGISWQSIVAMVVLGTCPIMISFCLSGMLVKSELLEVMHTMNASRAAQLFKVRLPLSAPYVLSGLKMILPFGVIISIVSQYFGGAADALGSQIRSASSQFHATDMWAAIVAACLLGLCAYAIGIAAEWAVNKRLLRQG